MKKMMPAQWRDDASRWCRRNGPVAVDLPSFTVPLI